ncbi:uncharacterized protein CC84DRAFT_1261852 [Paraphaeosphaeria sporulosa]|uniref:Ubiquitin-like domain-containing protein n=1 Tax=Paraphaeosphaeria sporulosa TaxID=1460663 RepID=A0A177C681_9PLEO|nr:uncharacterized protein CC84DRAFT_1261852 [Paraphaeosphaeria sporulosa]OAG03264.1 hypothetical protein CC84DRAFT_1261852 [Paraphaeosphaeria sporulosa]
MAEDATTLNPSIAPGASPIVDQPRGSAATSGLNSRERVRDPPQFDTPPLLFVRDGTGNKIPLPWEQAKEFSRFKSYVEELHARMEDKSWKEKIRKDEFLVAIETTDEVRVVLPSLWNDFVRPGMTVLIMFSFDEAKASLKKTGFSQKEEIQLYGRPEVEMLDVDVDLGGKSDKTSEGEFSAGTKSSDNESSVHSDGEESEEDDSETDSDDQNSKAPSVSEDEDASFEAPSAKPIRAIVEPVDKGGNPLSFALDTRWAAKFLSSFKVEDSSDETLTKTLRNTREMAAETLKITKAVTTTADNRTTLEVHTLPGPENSALSGSVGIWWYHLHGEALDWSQFKTTCMTIPNLSERTRFLIFKTLHKVEKESVKAFLGGLFVDPGTVVRGDECNQPDPQSIIFSCTPYFEIQKSHPSSSDSDRLHPARTLIQTYYPYEPVKDRDDEQAYRSIGNAREGGLIHVPTLWMLNVGNRAVVTCGYGPLSSDFTKSIKVLREDLKQLGAGTGNSITSVRLTVPDGRVLLYSPQECGTFFQLEQRTKELQRSTRDLWSTNDSLLLLQQWGTQTEVTPENWPAIIRQRQSLFIDVAVAEKNSKVSSKLPRPLVAGMTRDSVPPFFHWPTALSKYETSLGVAATDEKYATKCLEKVEHAMLNVTLYGYPDGPVQQTFTSTKYYESLHEDTFENVEKSISAQIKKADSVSSSSECTHHQNLVRSQSSKLPSKAHDFAEIVHDTLGLFLGDINGPVLVQKVWGAIANIAAVVENLSNHRGYDPDSKEYNDPGWRTPKTKTRAWRIRMPDSTYTFANEHATKFHLPLPGDDKYFGATLKRCRRCAREQPFDDPDAALEHLKKHAAAEASKPGGSTSSSFVKDNEPWKDWIRNDDQALLESTMAGACAILDRANEEARKIYEELKELADGVRNEQGDLSNLYSFPRKLLEALHRLIVFYLAVERSLHYIEECFNETRKGGYREDYPYTDAGLGVLNAFRESAKVSVLQAREELCDMVRSTTPNDVTERLSWGAESISSWLIRRLIVKPLEKSMTVGDMYREYLSTLQFQVNHRPGKRLLRSINLLQEELTILAQVNDWQTQLVTNYMTVLDDATYPADLPYRRALYPYERLLLTSCLDNLALNREEYDDQIRRCGPLSNSTKQSAEINEEDHGKAILVFTVVTVIFLPLSFVTSYLGMNTSDIRDMDNKQSLFWEIALPLTVGIMAIMLAIAYNGDEIRDFADSLYRVVTGKQDRRLSAGGISVLQRKRAAKGAVDSATTLSMADDAEYVAPRARPDYEAWHGNAWDRSKKTVQAPNVTVYREEIDVLPQTRFARSSRIPALGTSAFPKPVPYSYTEPAGMPVEESAPTRQTFTRTRMSKKTALQQSYSSRYDRTPPPPPQPLPLRERPTYTKVHKKYVVPSVLDDAYLPWSYDDNDPDYIIIRQDMQKWETDALFERSREVREGRGGSGARTSGRYGGARAGHEYVWTSKKEGGRRSRRRRGGKDQEL